MAIEIPLTKNHVAIVDSQDAERVKQLKWHSSVRPHTVYALAAPTRKTHVYLHRFILGAKPGEHIDHIDGNGLNNTRTNLRVVTRSQQSCNTRKGKGQIRKGTSKYKGVYLNKARGRYYAKIHIKGTCIGLGSYQIEEEAARAYDAAAKQFFGEYARLNFNEESRRAAEEETSEAA